MTTSPSEPVDNAQVSDAAELPSSDLEDDTSSGDVNESDDSAASAIAAESTTTDPPV